MNHAEREKALEEFERTKDILLLKRTLGHKNIKTTFALLERRKKRLQT